MAQMTASQIAAELQRKKNLGLAPTSAANKSAYDQLSVKSPAQTGAVSGGIGVRQFLNDNGINNVGFDNKTKTVTADGQSFMTNPTIKNGTALGNQDELTSALIGLQNRQSQQKVKGLMGQVETAINTPYKAPEFNYSLETDPQYIAALSRAKANAQTASGNAMAELNKRGILNSTITGDRLGQIEQAEYGRVSDELVPQLMQQAYGRYRDSVGDGYRASRDNIGDLETLLGLESDTNQRGIDNYNTNRNYNRGVLESDRTFNRNNMESDRSFNRGVLESDRGFDRGVLESDRNYDRGVLESDRGYDRNVLESDRNFNRGVLESDRNYDQNSDQFWAGYNQDADQFQKTLDGKNAPETPSAQSVADYTDKMVTRDEDGKIVNQDSLAAIITNSGLDAYNMWLMYQRYGIPWNAEVPTKPSGN